MKEIDLVIVSLFDGPSGARVALDRVTHLNVLRYYSSEIDKYAIQVADYNYPEDIPYRLGDVTKVDGHGLLREIRKDFGDVSILLIGGSPCQGFSVSGKMKGSSTACGIDVVSLAQYLRLKKMGFEFDGQSYLFWEYARVRMEINPDYFLLENVRVTKKWLPMFSRAMGVEPLMIDSKLVSAQNRKRYYWTNIQGVEQPDDDRKYLLLRDILDYSIENTPQCPLIKQRARGFNKGGLKAWEGKVPTVTSSSWSENNLLVERPCKAVGAAVRGRYREDGTILQTLELNGTGKSNAITTVLKDSLVAFTVSRVKWGRCQIKKSNSDGGETYRTMVPLELERLQTLPDNYTKLGAIKYTKNLERRFKKAIEKGEARFNPITNQFEIHISKAQRTKMIGNGFTTDAVAHILGHIYVSKKMGTI